MRWRVWSAGAALAAVAVVIAVQAGVFAQAARALALHRTPSLQVPEGWPAPRYVFADNPVTRAGFALGRALFYEPLLSRDGTVSCGSCHQQFAGFAHFDHKLSHGVGGVNGTRNAPALANLAWQPEFMWDGAVHHLEVQPVAPISNPLEMGETLDGALRKLSADPRYPPRFEAAFGTPGIDSQRLLRALAQFTGTLVSAGSRYDRSELSAEETAGLGVFRQHCASCHAEPLFTDFSYRNNGLDGAAAAGDQTRDAGRARITGRPEDAARFRVPSLRNVAVSGPYMHDGRYETLDAVLDHYSRRIQPSPTLDPQLATPLALTAVQRRALRAFLEALTDDDFLADARFAEPVS